MFKEVFADDFIKMGRKVVRPFSIAWYAIRGAEVLAGVGAFYVLYCTLWMIGA